MQNGRRQNDEKVTGGGLRIFLVCVSLALSVLIGLALGRREGGAATASHAGKVRIGLSFDTLKEERWQRDRRAFIERANALGAEVIDLAANGNDTQQIRDVESLISNKVNVIVIAPHNGAAMAKAVELAHRNGIPLIAYDRLITGCDLDFYISFDGVKVGETQARYLLDHLNNPGRAKIVRIYGAKIDHNALLVKQGQDNLLQPALQSGKVEVVHEDWADEWKPENAKRITNAAISRHGTAIDGILASNDGTAGGAVQALLEEGLAGKILVTGQDAELAACQRIWRGTQAMTVYKPLKQLAGRAAEVAAALARGKPVVALAETDNGKVKVPAIFINVIAVDKSNLMDTVVRDGFHSAAAITAP